MRAQLTFKTSSFTTQLSRINCQQQRAQALVGIQPPCGEVPFRPSQIPHRSLLRECTHNQVSLDCTSSVSVTSQQRQYVHAGFQGGQSLHAVTLERGPFVETTPPDQMTHQHHQRDAALKQSMCVFKLLHFKLLCCFCRAAGMGSGTQAVQANSRCACVHSQHPTNQTARSCPILQTYVYATHRVHNGAVLCWKETSTALYIAAHPEVELLPVAQHAVVCQHMLEGAQSTLELGACIELGRSYTEPQARGGGHHPHTRIP